MVVKIDPHFLEVLRLDDGIGGYCVFVSIIESRIIDSVCQATIIPEAEVQLV